MASSSIFLSNLLLLFSVLMCLLLSAEGEMATCFLLEGGLYFLCMLESERICCSLEYWVLYHSLLLNLVIMAYTIASDFSNVEVHL